MRSARRSAPNPLALRAPLGRTGILVGLDARPAFPPYRARLAKRGHPALQASLRDPTRLSRSGQGLRLACLVVPPHDSGWTPDLKPGWPRFAGVPGSAPTALTAAWAACRFGVSSAPLRDLSSVLHGYACGSPVPFGNRLGADVPAGVSGWTPSPHPLVADGSCLRSSTSAPEGLACQFTHSLK